MAEEAAEKNTRERACRDPLSPVETQKHNCLGQSWAIFSNTTLEPTEKPRRLTTRLRADANKTARA